MTAPASYAIALYVAGVNIIEHCPYPEMELDDLRQDPSTFRFVVQNAAALTIEQNAIVQVFSIETTPVRLIFNGYITKLRQKKRDNGISIEYEVDCEDRKVRLQKSVIPYGIYEGLDSDIIANLFNDAYPDLSDVFDYSSLVNNLADNLSLPVNDDSLLDKLKDLADLTGADWRVDKDSGGGLTITFDSGGWGTDLASLTDGLGYHRYNGAFPSFPSAIGSGGNPGNCVKWVDLNNGTITSGNTLVMLEVNLGGSFRITEISFDYYVNGTSNVDVFALGSTGHHTAIGALGAWHHVTLTINEDTQFPKVGFSATANLVLNTFVLDLRFDNIRIVTTTPVPEGDDALDQLVWDDSPDATDFNFDIDSSDEFGFDFNLDIGGYDDFNAVIVTGGKTEEAISWTYHGNIYEPHLGLELPVKDIVVSVNTNNDVSPAWSAIAVGEWGVDKLLDEGGTKDALYDTENHWLIFDSGVSILTLERAIKVEGKISRPIRVKVEDVSDTEPIFATTMHDDSITSEDQAAQVGFNELNKRKALRQMSFKTYEPNLKVGQSINVTDSDRGLNETLTIQRINTTWLGGKTGLFDVECGNAEASDASILISNNDSRSRKKAAPSAIGTSTASHLTDDSGNILTDDNDNPLFEIG